MLFTQDRNKLREQFHLAWQSHKANQPIEPLGQIIVNIVERHPEYHALLDKPYDEVADTDYHIDAAQDNPYLHLSLHIAVHEQVVTNRPAGIKALYYEALEHIQDIHILEHDMIDCLRDELWRAQQGHSMPNESAYIEEIRRKLDHYLHLQRR